MSVRYRSLLPQDVPSLVTQVSTHPILGARYGSLIDDFGEAVSCSLGRNYEVACAFEEVDGSGTRFLGAGLAVFVTAAFLGEVKTTPRFWVGPELVNRILHGASPLLSDGDVRAANSGTGLNLLIWNLTIHPTDLNRAEVGVALNYAFFANFLGFQLAELLAQADCLEHMQGSRNGGCLYFDRARRCYGDFPEVNSCNFEDEPRNVGLERSSPYTLGNLWALFSCAAPQVGFSLSEQRMLSAAFKGRTDEDLSALLNISLTGVKKRWRSIYQRVAVTLPHVFDGQSAGQAWVLERGKERRRILLAYLRDHPEELRPVSRKLLRGYAARS
jgi:hypothetical protein